MADNRTMEELLQAPTEGHGEAIVIPEINADHFEIKTNLLQLVQANPYHGFKREDPHTHINSFKKITSTLKFRDVSNDVVTLMMFPYSLEGTARVWYDKEPPNSILTWEDLGQGNNFNRGNNFHGNQSFQVPNQGFQNQPFQDPNNQVQQGFSNEFSSNKKANDQMMRNMQNQINLLKDEFKNEIQNTIKTQKIVLMEQQNAFQNNLKNMLSGFFQNQASTSGTLPSNTIPNPKGEMKAITTRSRVAYEGPSIPTKPSPKKVVERETEETTDKEQTNFQRSTAHIQPPVVPILKPNFRGCVTFDAKICLYIKSLLANKDKLFELAKIPLNEKFSAMLLKKLPKKLGDPVKFLIPCDFPGMDVCHSLADLGASINLMPLSILKKLSLPELTPTRMTLELVDRSITRPKGVAKDIFVKVEKFHFPTNFVVVEFEVDPWVPLILVRSFLKTGRGDPTSTFELIISDSSPSFTPFEGSDFILKEIEAYLKDKSISPEIDHVDCDLEGYICLIEKLVNDDPFQLPLMDLKQGEVVKAKSTIEEPLKLELKYLPSHLEYAYLEGADKLPVIIVKDLKVNEKQALLNCLENHRHQGPWVSPIHCVPKKGGITVVENENNEHIPNTIGHRTFQRCMMAIFHDMIGKTMKVFMDDFLVFVDSFSSCLSHLVTKGIDFMGPFSSSRGNRFGTPRAIISDRGTYFCNEKFAKVMSKENRISRSKKLEHALLAFRTAYKTPIGCTPYKLVYRKSFHLPIELEHKAYWALKHVNFDLKTTGDHLKLQLNELNELRDKAYENSLIYKEKTKKLHDSKMKNRIFSVGDRVLLFNSCLKIFSGKLKTHWFGPFTITQVFPYGTIELSQPEGLNFKVNGHQVKNYFGGDVPQLSGFTSITLDDQSFTVDGNVDYFLTTENFGMILRQPVHTNDDVNATEFNRHEINFEWERFCVIHVTFLAQGKVSNMPTVHSWGGCIGPDGFLPFILLLVVVVVVFVIVVVAVILVVVVVVDSSIIKLSFVITGWANEFYQDKASSVRVPVANFALQFSVQLLRENTDSVHSNQRMSSTVPSIPLKLKAFAMLAACASRAVATLSATSFLMAA
nr:hypothetical protein [Tanacetum cinerariifolium]